MKQGWQEHDISARISVRLKWVNNVNSLEQFLNIVRVQVLGVIEKQMKYTKFINAIKNLLSC